MPDSDGSLRVIIIGGSIAGLCCAHALLKSGVCKVMVLERAKELTSAGAGLAIDQLSCEAFEEWGLRDALFRMSEPLDAEENRAVDIRRKVFVTLARDENFRYRAINWDDLHRILSESLPDGIAQYGHEALSLEENTDRSSIRVSVSVTSENGDDEPEVTKEVDADIIVAADGNSSRMRHFYFPDETRRYSGYCAWRGILDCTDEPQVYEDVRRAYPDMGETMYFELARGSHAAIYESKGKMLNWLWYIHQPEPALKCYYEGGNSHLPGSFSPNALASGSFTSQKHKGTGATVQPDAGKVAAMHDEADRTWMPALAKAIKLTSTPSITPVYDKDPPKQLAWTRVVLVGEAAHPTTPHASRSTNMAIVDAHELGKALRKYGPDNVNSAFSRYESKRLPSISQHVLFSRHLGQLKQGMLFEPKGSFPWPTANDAMVEGLLLRNMNSFQWRNL